MKKLLTILALFMTVICGSVFFVSCSNNYKKMYLVVEYCISEKGEDDKWTVVKDWTKVEDGQFDYFLSSDGSRRLHARVLVKGTSKEVDSLYISQSASSAIIPEVREVEPKEPFELLVNTVGSARFTITPSQGGEDKAVSFGVNVYKELESISQNTSCVPASVVGGYVQLESLTNLIKYEPVGETNQTGVDFKLSNVGSLKNDGTDNLLGREFKRDASYEARSGNLITNILGPETPGDDDEFVKLDNSTGKLRLRISQGYKLTSSNNVIELIATSKYYNNPDEKIVQTKIYVYIVEHFKPESLLVSYNPNVNLPGGNIPDDKSKAQPVDDEFVLYNSVIDDSIVDGEYNTMDLYTYTNKSIYSYETNPGMKLNVFINDVLYDYNDVVNNNFGIQVSPISKDVGGITKLVGLKFAVNPNSISEVDVYNIRLEVDFTAFNFTASGISPTSRLNKEFVIKVKNLASGFHINGRGYKDNLKDLIAGNESNITGYNSTQPAKLYASYVNDVVGMPLNIQATPTNAINSKVLVGFYSGYEVVGGNVEFNEASNLIGKLQLLNATETSVVVKGELFEIDFANKNEVVYLRFNNEDDAKSVNKIYMECKAVCTPDSFGMDPVEQKDITFVATIDVLGSVNDVVLYKPDGDVLNDVYLPNATKNKVHLNFESTALEADLSEVEITSAKGKIQYSVDGTTWVAKLTADKLTKDGNNRVLYIKTSEQCKDSIIISAPNGVSNVNEFEFVNIVSGASAVTIKPDETYIWGLTENGPDLVGIEDVTGDKSVELRYLALQSSRTAQFKAFGDNNTSNIQRVEAKTLSSTSVEYLKIIKDGKKLYEKPIATFSSGAIRVSNNGSYLFDISANSVGFTSILLVKVDFYAYDGDLIKPQSKYFIYEVAVYTPAREINVTTDRDSIIYINSNYPDVAKVEFSISVNNATRRIYFSSDAVNESINVDYGTEGTEAIYGISVEPSGNVNEKDGENNPYFAVGGLNSYKGKDYVSINTKSFSLQALQSLQPLQQQGTYLVSFDIMVYQFGKAVETTKVTKNIYLGDYTISDTIVLVSGVDSYNNVYMSLLDANADGKAIYEIEAYASNAGGNVTYKELGYTLYESDGVTEYTDDNLTITPQEGTDKFILEASDKGGVYELELYAKDGGYKTRIKITVSDGKTEGTAYFIKTFDEFVKLATTDTTNKYYTLWQDIDISPLSDSNTDYYANWWSAGRHFKGTLNGAITIEDPNNANKTIYRKYSLIGLRISNTNNNNFGLFNNVTGIIKNVVFNDVVINVTLNDENTADTTVNIGVITAENNGTIQDCNVNISGSTITFDTSAQNTTYNIGLIAGLNNGKIIYSNEENAGSNYSHIVDVSSTGATPGKLTIDVLQGNTIFGNDTNLHIGGVVGQNESGASIVGDYKDGAEKSVSQLINAVVNIELKAGYNATYAPMKINSIDLGGIAGLNKGTIKEISVSGSLVANDKVNIGGIVGTNETIVGTNEDIVHEVANFGTYIEGYSWNDKVNIDPSSKHDASLSYHGAGADQEQNIGGIVGYNKASEIDLVRVMFITFNKDEVAVASNVAKINGIGNVAGIVGKTNAGLTLSRAYVENFVDDGDNELIYNIIGNKANVAGLVASGSASVTLSFVNADFDVNDDVNVKDFAFYEFGKDLTYTYVYFIGDVLSTDTTDNELNNHNIDNASSYIVNRVVYTKAGETVKNIVEYGVDTVGGNAIIGDFNISWAENDEANDKYPYMYYKLTGETEIKNTLTIRPTDMIVNVDEKYFDEDGGNDEAHFEKYDDGLYIQYVNDNQTPEDTDDDQKVATAIVYYREGENNTHKLVTEGNRKGLIEKTILPNLTGVNSSYAVTMINGSNIATLTDGGSSITFEGVGKVELKFTSLYDRNVSNTVVLFVENPLHEDVINISTSAGIENRTETGDRFTTRVGVNSLLTLSMKDVNGQRFDDSKTYMTSRIDYANVKVNGSTNSFVGNETKLDDYFTITHGTAEIGAGSGKYALGQFNISAIKLDASYNYIEIPVIIGVYLNLDSYDIGENKLSELYTYEAQLIEKPIYITIYNKATGLTISSDAKAESGIAIDIEAKLTTGYTSTTSGNAVGELIGDNHERLILNKITAHDKIEAILTPANDNATDLLNKAKQGSLKLDFGVWDLFDRNISYVLDDNKTYYTYIINLRLKNDYRYLDVAEYDEREWKFNITIIADSNRDLNKSIEISFVPQTLIGLRLENYSNLVARQGDVNGTAVAEFVSNEAESSLIIPGESGLVKIFADYSYSYFENITITSSHEVIDGKEYFIRYQQMVYNKDRNVYESYAGITADGDTLRLKKVSYSDGSYDGVLFVRTILEEIVGVRHVFTMTVNADTYDLDGNIIPISRSKTVITQYRPGVYISVQDALTVEHEIEDVNTLVYLVENKSNVTTIVARVYGYEFNVEPLITISAINGSLESGEVAITQQGDITQDDTGAYLIKYKLSVNTSKSFKVYMKMVLMENGNTLTNQSETLYFYPVPYIINDVYLRGEANGGLTIPVNASKDIDLVWSTKNTTADKISDLNTRLVGLDYLNLFYVDYVNSSGQDDKRYFTDYLDVDNLSFSVKKNPDGKTYRIESLMKAPAITVHFNLWYGYVINADGTVNVNISEQRNESLACTNLLSHEFKLHLILKTTEDSPNPITDAEGLLAMSEGENYILMEDITLTNWVPLNTAIASLDGNGKIINIESFDITVAQQMNVGLFGTVSENTILKNIVLNISTMNNNLGNLSTVLYMKDDNVATATINFGLLAGVNNGLIYNCEVISVNSDRTLEIVTGTNYSLVFGGLVGVNQRNITNSRVGTEYFQRLVYKNGAVSSAIIPCGQLYFKTNGIVAGFVGQNASGSIITSSFVANTSVENTSDIGNDERNRTAGFVATNESDALIAYSYVKGLERNILTTRTTTEGAKQSVIYASGAGSVAGFVYMNTGKIHDCYTNTVCKSNASGVAGFVYNTVSGTVYQCYSASKVESGNTNTALATELPFVGVSTEKLEAQKLLSNADMINCYYYDDGTDYDDNYRVNPGAAVPKGLTLEAFINSNNLNNFSFINDTTSEQQLNGVWTYSTAVDRNRSTYPLTSTALPELTSANTISRSLRVLADDQANSEIKKYNPAKGYELGTKNNPYIIRSVEEYNNVFVKDVSIDNSGKKYIAGYVRFVDNIDFVVDEEYVNINTRSNYMLGDKNNKTFSLIDGNGMSLSNVVINYTENERGNLGLFSEIYYAVIKGLNVQYATQTNSSGSEVGSSTATYVGGVAGVAKNTYFIDINLTGNITLRAHNVVGGVVGRLTGKNSGLYNISSNLNVQAGNYSNSSTYVDENSEVTYLSYAGGIAGIADIGTEAHEGTNFNINKLIVDGVSVRANRAGGIAGYLGKDVNAKRLTYSISNSGQIFGREVAGGIVADNYADIKLSQANRDIDEQYEYDKKFAEYINSDELLMIDNSQEEYGNLNTITGDQIVGGFIGVNYLGDISDSLTKANIGHNADYGMGNTIGGFIGVTYGGDLKYVYAQNYIDLKYTIQGADEQTIDFYPELVGGIVGEVAYKTEATHFGVENVVANTWFDKTQIDAIYNYNKEKKDAGKGNEAIGLDYLFANVDSRVTICLDSETGKASNAIVAYGVFIDDAKYQPIDKELKLGCKKLSDTIAEDYNMHDLYYVPVGDDTSGVSTQQDIFNTLFAVWSEIYWYKEYTKFMPNLKDDNAINYIPIYNENDIKLIEQNPDGNFILMNDVYVDAQGNYVVPVNFTGVLIGTQHESEERYTRFNITLNANRNNDSGAGFFKSTQGARIATIGFNYDTFTLAGSRDYDRVGGVASQDYENTRFDQIAVSGDVKTEVGATVKAIGSIVAEAKRSKVISCNSSLNYNLSIADGSLIGGLVANLNGHNDEDKDKDGHLDNPYDGLISSSNYSGSISAKCETGGTTIGGIVANAYYTRISDCNVRKVNPDDGTINSVNIEVDCPNATNNIGGIIGKYDTCSLAYCSADINISPRTDASNANSNTYYIGGLVAQLSDTGKDEEIEDSYSRLTINKDFVKANTLIIGGAVANQACSADHEVVLQNLVSEINIKQAETLGLDVGKDVVGKIVLGGIVGKASGESTHPDVSYITNIKNSMAIFEVEVCYNNTLLGGGLIGQATGSYSIDNSTAMGFIKANNQDGEQMTADSTPTLTVLGGLVGLAADDSGATIKEIEVKQEIINSYTALTLSTAKVYKGEYVKADGSKTPHTIHANAIVGYTATSNNIDITNVVYSSDYVLAFANSSDTNMKFAKEPINVTANVLTGSEFDHEKVMGENGSWIIPNLTVNHLPMPSAVQDLLVAMKILEYEPGTTDVKFVDGKQGKAYYPKVINNQTDFNGVDFTDGNEDGNFDYAYYLLLADVEVSDSNSKVHINGVLLGNNRVITATRNLFVQVTDHSAVTNITIKLSGKITTGVVAEQNNGTILMVGVQYDDLECGPNFAGIATTNAGAILYCYNMGNSSKCNDVSSSGLVHTNELNARIEESYFTGSFAGGEKGSALVYTNHGYLKNCYSAGMASALIKVLEGTGRYSNVKYDYYANYVMEDDYLDWGSIGLEGVDTITLQEVKMVSSVKTSDSTVFDGWKVYSMHNLQDLESNPDETVGCTYNYGYPIHNIEQYTLTSGGNIELIPIRVKPTGDGTFDEINVENVNFAKGKLVYDEAETKIYDNFSFLINNIGVFSLINEITDSDSPDELPTYNKYFELEVNIILPDVASGFKGDIFERGWPGIGVATNAFAGVFATTPDIEEKTIDVAGTDKKAYSMDRTLKDEVSTAFKHNANFIQTDTVKTIKNLTGNALFANVESGALITGIELLNSYVNSAPLVKNICGDDEYETAYIATIYKVEVNDITTNTVSSISGLVDNVVGELNIYNSCNDTINIIATYNSKTAKKVAGLININAGTINMKESLESDIAITCGAGVESISGLVQNNNEGATINLYDGCEIKFKIDTTEKVENISGLVNTNLGEIQTVDDDRNPSTGSTVTFNELPESTTLAGLVATMNSGLIHGFDVKFEETDDDKYVTTKFGGVAADLLGGKLSSITVSLTTATADVFGGVASATKGPGIIEDVTVKEGKDQIKVSACTKTKTSEDQDCAYGLIIGMYEGLESINYNLGGETDFKVINGTNVGAIIGLAKSGTFNFTNPAPDKAIVYGKNNVGGFIGQYCGANSLVVEGERWVVGDGLASGYALVEVAVNEDVGTDPVVQIQNFGGIIGFWNTQAPLACSTGGGAQIRIINNNKLLEFKNGFDYSIEFFKNVPVKACDYIISNAGGVVGYSKGDIWEATNKAIVGYPVSLGNNSHEGMNPLSGIDINDIKAQTEINKIMQCINVGGIAGRVDGADAGGTGVNIKNCLNTKNVFGMYAVGGLVGNANMVSITQTNEKLYDPAVDRRPYTVVGLVDVGGVIGICSDTNVGQEDLEKIEIGIERIIGITGVGGVVGNATNTSVVKSSIISNQENSVIGNFNVGGIIGCGANARLFDVVISNVDVVGTIFDYKYGTGENIKPYYYMPTNIGGIVGYISTSSEFNNVDATVNVYTDNKFKIDADNECFINSEFNYIAKSKANKEYYSLGTRLINYLEEYYVITTTKTMSMDSGIGGFAGRLDVSDKEEDNAIDNEKRKTCTIEGNVNAPYGINVGGVIGVLTGNPQIVALPQNKTGEINVAGRIFVGGYFGKTNSFENPGDNFFNEDRKVINVNVQQYVDEHGNDKIQNGTYIGGVIGLVQGNVYAVNLTSSDKRDDGSSKIKVFNAGINTTYVGTLVGRLDGIMENCSIDSYLCDAKKVDLDYYHYGYMEGDNITLKADIKGIIQSPNVYNYGGLVGLVNTTRDVKVLGTHYYPFTVEMVQNSNYSQGKSIFKYNEQDNTKMLTAMAHYVNESKIDISVSALTAMYDEKSIDNCNPTNYMAKGWAKEYTLFRTLARVIDVSDTEPTGDSIQIVYNANYITSVYTTFATEGRFKINDDIIYTIYQPIGQTARLYCKYGIAMQNDEFDYSHVYNIDEGKGGKGNAEFPWEKNHQVSIEDGRWKGCKDAEDNGKMTDSVTAYDREAFWYHVEHPEELGLKMGDTFKADKDHDEPHKGEPNPTSLDHYCVPEGEDDDVHRGVNMSFGYTYFKPQYLGKEACFIFQQVFGYITCTVAGTTFEEDKTLYSGSGSLFEVSGVVSPITLPTVGDAEGGLKVFILIAIGVVLAIATFGVSAYAMGIISVAKIASVITTLKTILFAKTIKSLALAGMLLVTACATASLGTQVYISSKALITYESENAYSSIKEASMGYLTSNYARELNFLNGEMIPSTDGFKAFDVQATLIMEPGKTLSNTFTAFVSDSNTEASKYEKQYAKLLFRDGISNTCPLNLIYLNVAGGRNLPGDMNSTITIDVESLEGDIDGDVASINMLKKVFTKLGIKSYTIPRYKIEDDELYTFGETTDTGRVLVSNYSYMLEQKDDLGIPEYAFEEFDYYAYILDNLNHDYNEHVLPVEHEDYIKEHYNIKDVTITRSRPVKFSNSSDGALKQVDLNELRWRTLEMGDDPEFVSGLDKEVELKYYGTDRHDVDYSVKVAGKIDGSGNIYYKNDEEKYVSVNDNATEAPADADNTNLYFTLNGNGSYPNAKVKITLKPYIGGNGLIASQVGVSGNWYYQYDDTEKSYLNISCNFILGKYFSYFDNISADGSITYTKPLKRSSVDYSSKIETIYIFNKDASVAEGDDITEFFTMEQKVSLNDIYDNYDEWRDYSLTNNVYTPIDTKYTPFGDGLAINTKSFMYLADEETIAEKTVKYIYKPSYEGVAAGNFNNRYIYSTEVDGKVVKLYTRFKHDSDYNGFLSETIKYRYYSASEGKEAETNISIEGSLIPTSVNWYQSTNVIFGDCCRVTLCATKIYYGRGESYTSGGQIKANITSILS